MYRGAIVRADGISQCIATGSGEQASVLHRPLIESMFQLKYLVSDTQAIGDKVMAYRYCFFKEQEKLLREASEGKALASVLSLTDKARFGSMLTEINDQLRRDEFSEIASEYSKRKKAKKPRKSLHWYSMYDGPENLRDLSTHIGLEYVYILYKIGSSAIHAGDGINGVTSLSDGSPITKPIRWAEKLPYLCKTACMALHSAVETYLGAVSPNTVQEYRAWYEQNMPELLNDSLADKISITIHP